MEYPIIPDISISSLSNDSPFFCKEALYWELSPILRRLLDLEPDSNHCGRKWVNGHNPDKLWLYNWLTQSTRSVEEYEYVMGPLQQKVSEMNVHGYKYNGYLFRTAAEALVVRCPELEGRWKRVAQLIFEMVCKRPQVVYGSASTKLSNWIIRIIGDSYLLPNPQLRLEMLHMYLTKFVTINGYNREQALESLMSVCAFLDRREDSHHLTANDLINLFMLFTERTGFYQTNHDVVVLDDADDLCLFGLAVIDRLRQYRDKKRDILISDISDEYDKGLETLAQPKELQSLMALLKYFGDGAVMKESLIMGGRCHLDDACKGILSLIRIFSVALYDPELFNVTMSSIMDVMEAVVNLIKDTYDPDMCSDAECIEDIDTILEVLRETPRYNDDSEQDPIALEIIRKYKGRICKMRSLITEEVLEEIPQEIHDILYNDEY